MNKPSLCITCIGDIAPVGTALGEILYDGKENKKYFENLFSKSDIIFANLETPVMISNGIRANKKYVFRTHPDVLDVFPKKMVFSIANNHILDQGDSGLFETVENLKKRGFQFTGAGKNIEEAGKPVVINCKGKKIAFLASADERYQAAGPDKAGTFPALPEFLIPKIQQLKKEFDLVYLSIHMGMEYIPVPTPGMIRLANSCNENGADVVSFHHAHCVSGYTLNRKKAIFWGLGNFLFPEKKTYPDFSWSEAVAWHNIYNLRSKELHIDLEPFVISSRGMPHQTSEKVRKKTLAKIERISQKINNGVSLNRIRLRYLLKYNYLKMAVINYSDIARRNGLAGMFKMIFSSVSVLFLKKDKYV